MHKTKKQQTGNELSACNVMQSVPSIRVGNFWKLLRVVYF